MTLRQRAYEAHGIEVRSKSIVGAWVMTGITVACYAGSILSLVLGVRAIDNADSSAEEQSAATWTVAAMAVFVLQTVVTEILNASWLRRRWIRMTQRSPSYQNAGVVLFPTLHFIDSQRGDALTPVAGFVLVF